MNNIRLLNNDDLEAYKELMSNGYHNYAWDRYYLENVSEDCLKTILKKQNIGIFLVHLKMTSLSLLVR